MRKAKIAGVGLEEIRESLDKTVRKREYIEVR
jgi:hypothetical protein